MRIQFSYRLKWSMCVIILLLGVLNDGYAQSFLEDWNQVQDYYKNAPTLELYINMTTSTQDGEEETQKLVLCKNKDAYYYHLGLMELMITPENMLTIYHEQKVIVRQNTPENYQFGAKMLMSDTIFKAYQDDIQWIGVEKGERHYQIRPKNASQLIQVDYFFTKTGKNLHLRHVHVQYKEGGKLYQTDIKLSLTSRLSYVEQWEKNYFLKTENQKLVGAGKYKHYRISNQYYER